MIFYLCAEAAWTASSSRANHSQNGKNKNSVQRKQKKIHSCTKVEEKNGIDRIIKSSFLSLNFPFLFIAAQYKRIEYIENNEYKILSWNLCMLLFCTANTFMKENKKFFIYTTNDINHIHISYTRYVWVFSIHNVESYRLGRFWFFCCAC